ncbi:MAG: CoA-binding protein, partial [Myxococcota bacterium]
GIRFAPGTGHVVAVGLGGVEAEALAASFKQGEGMVLFSPEIADASRGAAKLAGSYAGRLLTGRTREGRKRVDEEEIERVLRFFCTVAREISGSPESGFTITDLEVNPFLISGGRLVAVDAVLRFEWEVHRERSVDPERMRRLLEPRTAALLGVSANKTNIGRIILRNLLRDGFPSEQIRVVRPGASPEERIDGVTCCPSISELPWEADLMVVAVAADAVPAVVDEVLETGKAASLVLIPGGMGETEAGKAHQRRIEEALEQARSQGRPAPVLVGPNCLGIRSRPGRYDTLFIPETKLPLPKGRVGEVSLVSQSGAFMITRMNRMAAFDPRYLISTGNQLDLTFTDFVEALLPDPQARVLGIYIEGFRPMDGLRLARLIDRGRSMGKEIIVYLAGRTSAGRTATSSHTASISGDYASAVAVLEDAGALLACTFEEFRAFLTHAGLLGRKEIRGSRLGLVSNAGYETVGMADNLMEGVFSPAPLTEETKARLEETLAAHGLGRLVNAQNPLDLTPMATDAAYEDCIGVLLGDATVDAMVVGVVPMTMALKTLPPGADKRGRDDVSASDALPARLERIQESAGVPMAFVVDAGELYDPMARLMEARGLPVLRSSDSAVSSLQRYLAHRLKLRG